MCILKQNWIIILIISVLYGCSNAASEAEAPFGPAQPGSNDFIAVAGNEFVLLTWPDAKNATSYDLYWSFDQNVSVDSASLIGNISAPYIHKNLSADTTYYYQLISRKSSGDSTRSNIVSTNLPAVNTTILTAEGSNGTITLTWDKQQENKLYTLYYYNFLGIDTEVTFQINNVSSPYPHRFLQNDLPYNYILTTTDQNGTIASNLVTAVPRLGTQISSINFYECFDLQAGIAAGIADLSNCPDNADFYFAYGGGALPNAAIFQNQCIGSQCQQSTEIAITDILYSDFTYFDITALAFTTSLLNGRFDATTIIKTIDGTHFKLGPIAEFDNTSVEFQWERLYPE